MQRIIEELYCNKITTEKINEKIEMGEAYMDELKKYLPILNETITCILKYIHDENKKLNINENFIIQILQDLIDGIEREDDVILLDTLRYGWIELLNYISQELQGESANE